MAQYLVVAHRTLVGDDLLDEVRHRIAPGNAFHLVVPVHHPTDHAWSNGEVEATARGRLEEGLARFHDLGAEADGEVGDVDPTTATAAAVRSRAIAGGAPFDEVLLSTLPPGISRWLRLDPARRIRERTGLPVTHVVGERASTASAR